jgi:hypothetical protein
LETLGEEEDRTTKAIGDNLVIYNGKYAVFVHLNGELQGEGECKIT